MTKDAKQAWGEVGDKFSSWGRRVADRYHAAGSAEARRRRRRGTRTEARGEGADR